MSTAEDTLLRQRLRVQQIIASALLLGVAVFLAIALIIVRVRPLGPPADNSPMLTLVAVVLFTVNALAAFVYPAFQMRTGVRKIAAGTWAAPPGAQPEDFSSDSSKLLAVRQTGMLVSGAILEGAAFLGCIAYLVEARRLALGVVAAAVFLMLVSFPTQRRVRGWLEFDAEQLAKLRQQRDGAAEP